MLLLKCSTIKAQKLVNKHFACVELYCEVGIKDISVGSVGQVTL